MSRGLSSSWCCCVEDPETYQVKDKFHLNLNLNVVRFWVLKILLKFCEKNIFTVTQIQFIFIRSYKSESKQILWTEKKTAPISNKGFVHERPSCDPVLNVS